MATHDKPVPSDRRGPSRLSPFALRWGSRVIPLRIGVLVVGRGTDCDVMLDSARVSRQHARLHVTADEVEIEDLGSINGVVIDSERISDRAQLRVGALLSLADEKLSLVFLSRHPRRPSGDLAKTMDFPAQRQTDQHVRAARRQDALLLLASVADKALAMGNGPEAERMLKTPLDQTFADVENGLALADEVTTLAAVYSTRLAGATRKPEWIDYAILLFTKLEKTLPMEAIDQLHELLRRVQGVNRAAFEGYLDLLKAKARSPADRFAIRRLEGAGRLLR